MNKIHIKFENKFGKRVFPNILLVTEKLNNY